MSLTNKVYGRFVENLLKAAIPDLSSAGTNVRVSLMHTDAAKCVGATGFSFDQAHDNWGQLSDWEVSDSVFTDYVRQTLGTKYVTYDGTGKRVTVFGANKTSFGAEVTIDATHAVVWYDSATPATSKLICCVAFGEEKSSVAGKFELKWDSGETDGDIVEVEVAA